MDRYLVDIVYTLDGRTRTSRPRPIEAATPVEAKTIALGNFARGRDGKRIKIVGAKVH